MSLLLRINALRPQHLYSGPSLLHSSLRSLTRARLIRYEGSNDGALIVCLPMRAY